MQNWPITDEIREEQAKERAQAKKEQILSDMKIAHAMRKGEFSRTYKKIYDRAPS